MLLRGGQGKIYLPLLDFMERRQDSFLFGFLYNFIDVA